MAGNDDDVGGDFSAVRVAAFLEMHIRECERKRVEDNQHRSAEQAEIREGLATIHARINSIEQTFDRRMGSLSGRQWGAAMALIGVLIAGIGYLLSKHII